MYASVICFYELTRMIQDAFWCMVFCNFILLICEAKLGTTMSWNLQLAAYVEWDQCGWSFFFILRDVAILSMV